MDSCWWIDSCCSVHRVWVNTAIDATFLAAWASSSLAAISGGSLRSGRYCVEHCFALCTRRSRAFLFYNRTNGAIIVVLIHSSSTHLKCTMWTCLPCSQIQSVNLAAQRRSTPLNQMRTAARFTLSMVAAQGSLWFNLACAHIDKQSLLFFALTITLQR